MNIKLNNTEFTAIVNEANSKIIVVTNEKSFEELKENIEEKNTIYVLEDELTYNGLKFEQMTEFADGTVKVIFSGGMDDEE